MRKRVMDRPDFQVDIQAAMILVAAVAVILATTHLFGPLLAVLAIPPAARLVAASGVRARCKADGREPGEADCRVTTDLALWYGLPVFLVAWIVAISGTISSRR